MSATQSKLDYDDADSDDNLTYRSPYSDITYSKEAFLRVHISRSEAPENLNHNGVMPEHEIEVLNEDGEVVDTISRTPEESKQLIAELTLDDVPDEYNDQHKCIILAGAQNYEEESYSVLEKAATDLMEEQGLKTLSYSTVRRVLREFYRPLEVQNEKEQTNTKKKDAGEQTLSDLTPTQQAIIIARLANPGESHSSIADRAGDVSASYPKQIYGEDGTGKQAFETVKQRIEDGEEIEAVIQDELSNEELAELLGQDFDLGIDVTAFTSSEDTQESEDGPETKEEVYDMGVGEQREAMSASPYGEEDVDEDTESDESTETWGGATDTSEETDPVAEANELQQPIQEARPAADTTTTETTADADSEVEADSDETTSDESMSVESTALTEKNDIEATPSPSTDEEAIPREEIESLREKVEFYADIAGADGDQETQTRDQALAQKIQEDLDEILAQ